MRLENDHLPGYLHAIFTDHYNKIAGEYDHLYDHVYEAIVAVAVKHLNLSPDVRLAEIGGGTGEVAHLIWKMAGIGFCSHSKISPPSPFLFLFLKCSTCCCFLFRYQ